MKREKEKWKIPQETLKLYTSFRVWENPIGYTPMSVFYTLKWRFDWQHFICIQLLLLFFGSFPPFNLSLSLPPPRISTNVSKMLCDSFALLLTEWLVNYFFFLSHSFSYFLRSLHSPYFACRQQLCGDGFTELRVCVCARFQWFVLFAHK